MKVFLALSLLVAVTSAGVVLPSLKERLPVMPRSELQGRITNGELAEEGQFPYQVGLSLVFGNFSAWCGGTLLSDQVVLTAAHCTDEANGVTIYLGAINISNLDEPGQQRVYADKSRIIVHEGWDPATFTNDISLIKMPVKVKFNSRIQPATLPKKENGEYSTYVGDMVFASGWGRESDSSNTVSEVLRYIEVPVMKQSTCNTFYFGLISKNMICISTKGGSSTCNGDSGGPLVKTDGDVNIVIGATSFGIAFGCQIGWPGVFTRVTAYLDWIEAKTGLK